MAILSLAWWLQKLSGITAQAVGVVLLLAVLVLGVVGGGWWLRHDARLDERKAWELAAAVERNKQLVLSRIREREAGAIGRRAEKDLLRELDASAAVIEERERQLAARPPPKCEPGKRVICYPRDIVKSLNR
jgi:uncharacterized protein HemX